MVKKEKEFLVLAVVSIVIVVALFVSAPSGSSVKGAIDTTRSTTGTVWTCAWDNNWRWSTTYDDGSTGVIGKYIKPETINCDPYYWDEDCKVDYVCNTANMGKTCICEKQKSIDWGEGSSS